MSVSLMVVINDSCRRSSRSGWVSLLGLVRRLSVPEIVELGQAMRHAALKETESPIALAIVRLLLLTGFRISERQDLERAWVSAAEGYVGFPDTKGDAQVRAIGPSAGKLIAQQPVRVNSPYVFPSEVGEGHYTAGRAWSGYARRSASKASRPTRCDTRSRASREAWAFRS